MDVPDSEPKKWFAKVRMPAAVGGAGALVGYLGGRALEVPLPTEFWGVAAQPLATAAAGAGAITAGYLAFYNGEKSRRQEAQKHRETMDRDHASELRARYTTAARQLGDDNAAIREAGIYAIAAIIDDWIRSTADHSADFTQVHGEVRACVNLLCSYLRANRRTTEPSDQTVPTANFTVEESSVRSSIVSVLRDRSGAWHAFEDPYILNGSMPERSRISIDLSGANLVAANFDRAVLSGAQLIGTNLADATFAWADLSDTAMGNSILTRAWLVGSDLTGARTIATDFQFANLSKANLSYLNAVAAKFSGASFAGAKLEDASLVGCHFDVNTNWSPSTLWPDGFSPDAGQLLQDRPMLEVLADLRMAADYLAD